MKKFILSAVSLIAVSLASTGQSRIGIVAGGNISNQRMNVSGESTFFSNDDFKGYHAGLASEVKISNNLYLQPQLLYSRKGATLLSSKGAPDTKVRFSYIELPVNIIYKVPLSFATVFGGAGAAFSYGIGGRQEQGGQKTGIYSDGSPWRHKDLALSFTAGIELNNGFFISANSRKGMLNIHKDDGVSVKHRATSVSVGYFIQRSNRHKG